MQAKLEAIKKQFIDNIEADPLAHLNTAVRALKVLGFNTHIACALVTHWAVEAGYIDSEDEEVAERQAEEAVA